MEGRVPLTRTSIGYDVQRFEAGRRLVLGGVEIEHDEGLEGHSDADVLAHAVMDALLGAAGLGDIGEHFPPSDERYRDADSIELLRDVVRRVGAASFAIANVDVMVLIEAPRLSPHRETIRARLAEALGTEPARVNVKATTGEGLGFVGRKEGAAALAVATLVENR
jgi:2-C-methyl-D-erythritol 2,4-cyclodiphosphate synthase